MKRHLLLFTLLQVSVTVFAQSKPFIFKVSGALTEPLSLTLKDIASMPHHTEFLNDRDGKSYPYSGVAIQDILSKAGATVGKKLRGENLTKYVLAKCADGYEVLYSLPELDSSFTNNLVILADSSSGKALPEAKGPLRLVIPNEKIPARSCFQVVELIVGYAKD